MPQVDMSLKGRGKALGGSSSETQALGTFHSNSQSRKPTFPKALGAGGTRVGRGEVLPPCGHFLELHLPASADWHLRFKRPVRQVMTAALRKGPASGIAEVSTKHT